MNEDYKHLRRKGFVMSSLPEIDNNFIIETNIDKKDIVFYDIENDPFKIYGVFRENGLYRRMPEETALKVSEKVHFLHANTAGGRVRFVTDSQYVAVYVKMRKLKKSPHFALAGSIGMDLYADNYYVKSFIPPFDIDDGFESIIEFSEKTKREITINLSLYSEVKQLFVGIQKDAVLEEAKPYINKKPIVYYGSSITQGACASRPGMSYQSIISRTFDYDYINLGFSGSAKAEDAMIEYIKNLDMSAFVYDYDHNAPNPDYLKETHERGYKTVREKNPDLPIIFVTKPDYDNNASAYRVWNEDSVKRRTIVMQTYINAINAGDKNVYFIDGSQFFNVNEGDCCVADGCHPTDLGFMRMADVIGNQIDTILSRRL